MDPNGYIDLCVIFIVMRLSFFPIAFPNRQPINFDYYPLFGVQQKHVLYIVSATGFLYLGPLLQIWFKWD